MTDCANVLQQSMNTIINDEKFTFFWHTHTHQKKKRNFFILINRRDKKRLPYTAIYKCGCTRENIHQSWFCVRCVKIIAEISVLKNSSKRKKLFSVLNQFEVTHTHSVNYFVTEMDEVVEAIRTRIANVDRSGPRKITGVFQLNVKNEDGSTRPITLDLNKLEVLDDNVHESPDVSVDFDADTLGEVTKNKLSFCDAVKIGRIAVTGNQELAKILGHVVNSKPIMQ